MYIRTQRALAVGVSANVKNNPLSGFRYYFLHYEPSENISEDAIKEIFWNRILENLDEYMNDFKANKDRIAPMMEKDNIDDEHIELLKKILN